MLVTRVVLENIFFTDQRYLWLLHQATCMGLLSGVCGAAPDLACCCAQVFREPVTLPSGLSYEESALMEHFAKVRERQEHNASNMAFSLSAVLRCRQVCGCAAEEFAHELMLFMPTSAGWALGPHHQGALQAQPGGEEPEPACGSAALS